MAGPRIQFAAVIVTYYPDKSTLEYLRDLSMICEHIVIVDNTARDNFSSLDDLHNITTIINSENIGLASAFNIGISKAREMGVRYVFLFDQDTRVSPSFFENMLSFYKRIKNITNKCALCVPDYIDRNLQSHAIFPLVSRFKVLRLACNDIKHYIPKKALISITSGSLLDIEKYEHIGPLRDDYFIDFVDIEYCLRINTMGLVVALNCNEVIDHSVGKRENKRFININIKPNHHLPLRRYYIARNGVYTTILYLKKYPAYAFLSLSQFIHELISIVIYERNKIKKIYSFALGLFHGLTGKMGKLNTLQ